MKQRDAEYRLQILYEADNNNKYSRHIVNCDNLSLKCFTVFWYRLLLACFYKQSIYARRHSRHKFLVQNIKIVSLKTKTCKN